MHFLSNGDFGFPFTWPLYYVKQFFLWSYQGGAANADGVIRMPGRLLDLLVFMLFGNVAFEYFLIFSSLAIVYVSFFYFSGKFLEIQSLHVRLIASLFFTINPIFLGNLSKIGLILAAAMLPLCLVMIKETFREKRIRYLLPLLVFLNISLIHPYNFTVNLAVCSIYFAYKALQSKRFFRQSLPKLILIAGLFVLLNAYFILPLASMRTVSKDALSDTVSSTPTDYTALVGTLNTGDILTGLSLSKNVVKDYDFYSVQYAPLYFLGTFLFYVLLFGLFVRVEKHLHAVDRRRVLVFLVIFLALIVLATVNFLNADLLIKALINLPGGWAFRSPLKWQLYIPLALAALLAILVSQVRTRLRLISVYAILGASFLLMNGFLFFEVGSKLLTPKTLNYFAALQRSDLEQANLLLIKSSQCWSFEQNNPQVMTELSQILRSKNTQIKQINANDITQVNIAAYDYVLTCQGVMQVALLETYDFGLANTFVGDAFQLYANKTPRPYIYVTPDMFKLARGAQPSTKYNFVNQNLHKNFDFISSAATVNVPVIELQDLFEDLSFKNLHRGAITTSVHTLQEGTYRLHIQQGNRPLYYRAQDSSIELSSTKLLGYNSLQSTEDGLVPLHISSEKKLKVTYTNPAYNFKNLIPNPSFEQGPWQKKVQDCYAYDDRPQISMSLDRQIKTAGRQSLRLEAANHVACTNIENISVKAGGQYLLSFDYYSPQRDSGYLVTFNDAAGNILAGRLPKTHADKKWQTFTQVLTIPPNANALSLRVEMYPNIASIEATAANYDHFQLVAIPALQGKFNVVSDAPPITQSPAKIEFSAPDPTKSYIHIKKVRAPFYVGTGETYAPQWQLILKNDRSLSWSPLAKTTAVAQKNHLTLNNSMNGWYVEPAKICADNPRGCTRNPDGSYDMQLIMEYAPQRWFYAGVLLSGSTFLAAATYFTYDYIRHRPRNVTGYRTK